MSAVLRDDRLLVPMTVGQLDVLLEIEQVAYAFPWTRGNFIDSLSMRYPAQVLYSAQGQMLGYFVAMLGVDEVHLLNITVRPEMQGLGHARFMLDELRLLCRVHKANQLWLEVRESNARARAVYQRYGFAQVGIRRGYYPAARNTHPNGREDAIVMKLYLSENADALG